MRAIDVGLEGRATAPLAPARREERGEELRLAYVALTRARHQAVSGGRAPGTPDSPLGRLLFAQDDDGNVAASGADAAPTPPGNVRALRGSSPQRARARWPSRGRAARLPAVARRAWRPRRAERRAVRPPARLEAGGAPPTARSPPAARGEGPSETRVGSEPDEPEHRGRSPTNRRRTAAGPSPPSCRSRRCRRPAVGTLMHRALEAVDFTGADLEGALRLARRHRRWDRRRAGLPGCEPRPARLDWPALERRSAALWVPTTHATWREPTGSTSSTSSCRSPAAMRRWEARPWRVAALLRREWLPAGRSARRLRRAAGRPGARRGPARLPDGHHRPGAATCDERGRARYAIVDYKTNWLAAAGEPLTAWHYRPAALAAEMQRSHYALQALLYRSRCTAYLRWRVVDYDPDGPRRRPLPVPARDARCRRTPRRRHPGCSPGSRRPRLIIGAQ
jgi:exodeoxyribonuclease V beta subunit